MPFYLINEYFDSILIPNKYDKFMIPLFNALVVFSCTRELKSPNKGVRTYEGGVDGILDAMVRQDHRIISKFSCNEY